MVRKSEMSQKTRRKSRKNRKLILIIILLLLCLVAALYILKLTRSERPNDGAAETGTETETEAIAETGEEAEEVAKEAEEIASEAVKAKAASHVYSHRGSAGDDELSMDAYDRAVEAGSKYLEADMVVSASGTIYVAHDDYAKDMTGIDGYFSGMTDAQIDQTKTRNGYSIIKLSDLFDKYGDSVTYLIDIKYTSARNINAFADIVREYGYEENVIATSFYMNALGSLENSFPEMTKLFLCSDQATFNVASGTSYVDIVCVPKDFMTEDNLKAAHDNDKLFSAWTLNTEEEIKQAIDMGVDTYFTDDTALALRLEAENRTE